MMGKTQLKQHYLGGTFVGQDLCYYKIEVSENAITCVRYKDGHQASFFFTDDPSKVSTIKQKLRAFVARVKLNGRDLVESKKKGYARITSYYPSVSWGQGTGRVMWMGEGF
jgi:hypothetical protein